MSLTLFLFAIAAPAAPITVTGHAWAPFISPMGEPFRARSITDDTLAKWFVQADRNHDGVLTADEMIADGDRFFATLDSNNDGQLDPDEIANYEWQIAPEIQVNNKLKRPRSEMRLEKASEREGDEPRLEKRRRVRDEPYDPYGLQGAARYALLNIPEPVAAADLDFNRGVTLIEFRQAAVERFSVLARTSQGNPTYQALAAMLPKLPKQGARPKPPPAHEADRRIGTPVPREP